MGLLYFEMKFTTRFPYSEMKHSALFPRIFEIGISAFERGLLKNDKSKSS